MMKRREFIAGLGAVAWPVVAWAQQGERVRRIGVLAASSEEDLIGRANLAALREGLAKLGWVEGRNLRIDLRFWGGDPDRGRTSAVELVSLAPEVIVTASRPDTTVVQEQTKTTYGLLQNIARPEGNTTGFTSTVDSASGKWLELLKEAAPHITRVALVFNPQTVNVGYFGPIEAAASQLGVQALKTPVRDTLEIVRAIDAFAAEPNGSVLSVPVLSADSYQMLHRVAAEHRLPGITDRRGVAAGGLMSYGSDITDNYRRAAGYVDRLLHGAKVSELPVQFPTRFRLAWISTERN
jgi:putative tryptophan/tyrosine transport system substrate-binding protein